VQLLAVKDCCVGECVYVDVGAGASPPAYTGLDPMWKPGCDLNLTGTENRAPV